MEEKRLRLRYAGTCHRCGVALPAGTDAVYHPAAKTVRCVECRAAHAAADEESLDEADPATIDPGTPGASARREFERRHAKREDRIRARYPRLGGLLLALSDDPQSTRAWDTGAVGEERVGDRLNELSSETLRVLHDRRVPGSSANIDHLAVVPTGVFVIDPKRYKGRPHLMVEGGLVRPRVEKLRVSSRDCTKLVDGVLKQVDVVRGIVGDSVPVHGILCFIDADWPLIGGSFTIRGVEVLWPKKLFPKLAAPGPLSAEAVGGLHRQLAAHLRPA